MRLGYDLSVLRHPPAGTARYATALLDAMRSARPTESVIAASGWPRRSRAGGIWRPLNLASDLGWLTIGANVSAVAERIDAWFSPANVLPLALPRPKIVTIHDVNVIDAASYSRGYAAYARTTHAGSGKRASAVVVDSANTRMRVIEAYGIPAERVHVAYPGIDHLPVGPTPQGASSTHRPYALFVGQTEPHKNVVRLVDAWAADVPVDLDLVIAGPPGRAETDLRAAIDASPARHRIRRLGRVTDADLGELYAAAACFVFPSMAEGFGLPPLEAMAHGIPTAVADAASLPEVTDGAALTFDPTDTNAIADAVRRLIMDTTVRDRLTVDGPRVAARYRWATTAQTVWSVIDRVVHA